MPRRLADQMNATSGTFDDDESEFDATGLTRAASKLVRPPGVAEADVRLECRVSNTLEIGDGGPMSCTVVFGEVVMLHAADRVLDGGRISPALLDAIGRLGGTRYATTRDVFELDRPE